MNFKFEPSYSYGYDGGQIQMVDEDTMVSIAANSLKFSSKSNPIKQHFHLRQDSTHLTVFDVNWSKNLIAYASCEQNPDICVISYPDKKHKGRLRGGSNLEFSVIRFSRCGKRLVSICLNFGCQVCVWDVDRFQLLCSSSPSNFNCTFASFNPKDFNDFVTGGNNGIKFWKIRNGCDSYFLNYIDGVNLTPEFISSINQGSEQDNLIIEEDVDDNIDDICLSLEEVAVKRGAYSSHCWNTQNEVYAANLAGELVIFNPQTGKVSEIVPTKLYQFSIITSLILSTNCIVVATSIGQILWVSRKTHSVVQSLSIPKLQYSLNSDTARWISSMAISPAYDEVVVCMKEGILYNVPFEVNLDEVEDEGVNILEQSALTVLNHFNSCSILAIAIATPFGGNASDAVFLTGGLSEAIHVWNIQTGNLVVVACGSKPEVIDGEVISSPVVSMSSRYFDPVIAVGNKNGTCNIFAIIKDSESTSSICPSNSNFQLVNIHSIRLSKGPLDMLDFHISRPLLAASSSLENNVFVINMDPEKNFQVIQYSSLNTDNDTVSSITWVSVNTLEASALIVSSLLGSLFSIEVCSESCQQQSVVEMLQLGKIGFPANHSVLVGPLNSNMLMISATKKILQILTFELTSGKLKEEELVEESHNVHQMGILCISKSFLADVAEGCEIVATGGAEGLVALWYVYSDEDQVYLKLKKKIYAHNGGVSSLCFVHSEGYSYLFSTGIDGSLFCFSLQFEGCYMVEENIFGCSVIYSNLEWKTGNYNSEAQGENDFGNMIENNCTYLEQVAIEAEAKEATKHEHAKESVRLSLKSLQIRLQDLIAQNDNVHELEKLSKDEFIINIEGKNLAIAQNEERASAVRTSIKRQIAELDLISERFKIEFWDSGATKGVQLVGMFDKNTVVYNFPARKLSKEQQSLESKIKLLREIELRQLHSGITRDGSFKEIVHFFPSDINWMIDAGLFHPSLAQTVFELQNPSIKGNSSPRSKDRPKQVIAGAGKSQNDEDMDDEYDDEAVSCDKVLGATENTNDSNSESIGDINLLNLIYHPGCLRTQKQRRTQILLLLMLNRFLKDKFNIEFEQMHQLKETKMEEIESKNKRILEINGELSLAGNSESSKIFYEQFKWSREEIPDSVFNISDDEIQTAPYETAEMKKQKALEQEEADRQAELRKKDDVYGRALDDMMHGTLENKKDTIRFKVLEREPWMEEIAYDDMTTEQKAEFNDFEIRCKMLQDEQEKFKKSLELEKKKLLSEIKEVGKAFDIKLKELLTSQMHTKLSILMQQLYALKLGKNIMDYEYLIKKTEILKNTLNKWTAKLNSQQNETISFQKKYENSREDMQKAIDEDKACEKNFPREIEEATDGIPLDQEIFRCLLDLFRQRKSFQAAANDALRLGDSRRKRNSSTKISMDVDTSYNNPEPVNVVEILNPNDPFAIDDLKSGDIKNDAKYAPLHEDYDCPEGINPEEKIWRTLVALRDKKIALEGKVRSSTAYMNEVKKMYEEAQLKEHTVNEEIKNAVDELHLLKNEINITQKNIPLLAVIKQGQDEFCELVKKKRNEDTNFDNNSISLENSTNCRYIKQVFNDENDAILIAKSDVEKLNERIQQYGKEQVTILARMKNFRKNINLMEWEHNYLEMKKKNLENHYTDLQLLRVTKHLQEFLKTGEDVVEKQKQEMSITESKFVHIKKNHSTSIEKIDRTTAQLSKQVKQKKMENQQFMTQLQELEQHVKIREEIAESRTLITGCKKNNSLSKSKAKMKAITVRRKLVELAKSQTEEIEFLRLELDKLRRKTFPSFVQPTVEESRMPDEI